MIAGYETCSEDAEIPFDNILDQLTGSDPSVTGLRFGSAGEVFERALQKSLNYLTGAWPQRFRRSSRPWKVIG